MPDFTQQYSQYAAGIDAALDGYLPDSALPQKRLLDAMRYSLLAPGKRLRGIILLEFCRMLGGDVGKAMPFACALEMIHCYSLIHDDLPCMDNDDFRRGKPSNHKVYGEATALLAGSALLSRAFEVMLATACSEQTWKAAMVIAQASGLHGIAGGQELDIAGDYPGETVNSLKTSALFTAAAQAGCILAGADAEQLDNAERFGHLFGLAFQTADDYSDGGSEADKETALTLFRKAKALVKSDLLTRIIQRQEEALCETL